MATVTASVVGTGDSLETFRQQFNNLRTDVSGLSFDSTIVFEGSVADDFETTLSITNPTADRTITFPDKSDTLALLGDLGDVVLLNGTDSSGTDAGDNLVLDGPSTHVGDQILFEDATGDHLENPAVRNEVDILLETSTFAKKDFLLDERDSDRIEFESATQDPLIGGLFVPPAGGGPQFTMPTSDGLANQILGTDGSGNLSFINQSSGLSLANDANNRVITATGANSGNGEANLLFDGSTLTVTGNITATTITLSNDSGLIVPDDGNLGSASATNAIQISSGGIVTFVDDIKIKDGGTIGVATTADAMTIASDGTVTFKDDIIIRDAGNLGSASDPDAIAIASGGDVTLTGGNLLLAHDGAVLKFGGDSEITLTHVHNSGVQLDDSMKMLFGTGADAEIYHNGSNFYLDNGTGNILAYSDTMQFFSKTGSETFAQFNHNGAVNLYYDNSKKFETTSAGITVTGTISVTSPGASLLIKNSSGTTLKTVNGV